MIQQPFPCTMFQALYSVLDVQRALVRHTLLFSREETSKQLQNNHEYSICTCHIQEEVYQKYSEGERTAAMKLTGQWRTVKSIKEAQAGRIQGQSEGRPHVAQGLTKHTFGHISGSEFTTNKNNHIVISKHFIVGKFIWKPSLRLGCICAKIKKKML